MPDTDAPIDEALTPEVVAPEQNQGLIPMGTRWKPVPLKRPAPPAGFKPGQTRVPGSGRKKGGLNHSTRLAREIASQMKFDPIAFSIKIIVSGQMVSQGRKPEDVPMAERLKLLRDITGYIQPKLTAIQVTGKDDGPIQAIGLNLADLLANPELADMAQTLALAVAEREVLTIDQQTYLDESDEDTTEDEDIEPAED